FTNVATRAATAYASGSVSVVDINDNGSGYTAATAPSVTFTSPISGTTALATVFNTTPSTSFANGIGGAGYVVAPTVLFSNPSSVIANATFSQFSNTVTVASAPPNSLMVGMQVTGG